MGGRGKPGTDAAQSIVICSDVPCASMYVFLLLLSVTTFSWVRSSGKNV